MWEKLWKDIEIILVEIKNEKVININDYRIMIFFF